MTATRLPAALAPWAATLSALSPELAVALGPLLRRLDTLVGTREPVADVLGDPDGLGGLTRAGRPDRLLPSEWLLADAYPDEFLRRFVDGELLHHASEFSTPAVRGRIVALVDSGPAQAGAGRLVQLAALLVLHRRAAARGTELVVGVLGDPDGHWLTGDLAELLPAWLASRRPSDPTPEDVERVQAGLDAEDHAWVLTSPRLGGQLPGRARVLTSEPARWSAESATGVTVRIDGSTTELPLPAAEIAVRALRGSEFRRAASPVVVNVPAEAAGAAGGALPAFTTGTRTLLARGRRPSVLLAVNLPNGGNGPATEVRAKRHKLNGPVLAAGRIGRRLIALYARGDQLVPYVSGRPLSPAGGEQAGFTAELAAFGLDRAGLAGQFTRPVLPLVRGGDDLLLPLAGRWWRIAPDGTVTDDGEVGRGAEGPQHFNRFREPRLYDRSLPAGAARARHLLHSGATVAWSEDGRDWEVRNWQGQAHRISFRENADVIGLVHHEAVPALITCTRSGLLVRHVRADGVRTLTRFSGGTAPPAVHPTLPLIAAETRPGRIVVGDAYTGRIHHLIGSDD
ncbi:hypothetical protein J5Y04_06305 [Kitasatospora sp. RG8]|uniref:hypothetical protein n=1 Tax=Kitasatospora sp. RG8 TaxID=2820815 RepID=UPI001ADEF471|nr:hypothetical protein [Kitasatospora sp. RG8]MBP0449158.1 hypothetical protein [Kitasatospora sp. RG8]